MARRENKAPSKEEVKQQARDLRDTAKEKADAEVQQTKV